MPSPEEAEKMRQLSEQVSELTKKLATPVETLISDTKQTRKELDDALQNLKKRCEGRSSRERSLAITKIQEAIMWLGMDLKELGTPNPYPSSYDPSSPTVEPTADGLKL